MAGKTKASKGKMFAKSAAIHCWRLFSLGRIAAPTEVPGQMVLPMEVPTDTGPRLLPYVLYAVADPDGAVSVPLVELAAMVGKNPRTVKRWRSRIRELGFIAKVSSGNRYAAATYVLTVPSWAVDQMTQRYPDTYAPGVTGDTQGVPSSPSGSDPRGDAQGVPSRSGVESLEGTSERLEGTSPRVKCRLEVEEGGDPLRESPSRTPRTGSPNGGAPDLTGSDNQTVAVAERHENPTGCRCDAEVVAAAGLLADLIVDNGRKTRPTVTCKGWHRPIALMLSRDELTIAEVVGAIRWCQADPFWRGNILSPSKLRAKYDTLRLRAAEQRRQRASTPAAPTAVPGSKWAAAIALMDPEPDRTAIEGAPS